MIAGAIAACACAVALAGCQSSPNPPRVAASGYQVIVVGSGAGGGPLAARLARSGKRVLLLEAGQDVGGTQKYDVPAMHALATEDPAAAWWFFVRHHADAMLDAEDSKWTKDGILYPRGSALGGSTAVNAMVTVRPSRSDWNRIASLTGDLSWRADAMERYYDRVREWLSVELPDPALALGDRAVTSFLTAAALVHGASLAESSGAVRDPVGAAASLGALLEGDLNADLKHGEATGIQRLPLATRHGHRAGPRDVIVETVAAGAPLTVVTGALVTRVLFAADGVTANGVEIARGDGIYRASLAPAAAPEEREELFASE